MQASKILLTSATAITFVGGFYALVAVSTESVMMSLSPPAAGKSADLWAHVLYQEEEQAWLHERHERVPENAVQAIETPTEVVPEI